MSLVRAISNAILYGLTGGKVVDLTVTPPIISESQLVDAGGHVVVDLATNPAVLNSPGGIFIPAGVVLTNDGSYGGTPVLTGLTAGAGISVSSPTAPGNASVTNTGVLSLVAGYGIGLSSGSGNITVSSTLAAALAVETTITQASTQTVVATHTPATIGAFMVLVFYRLTAAATVTLQITWDLASGTVLTSTPVNNQAQPINPYSVSPVFLVADTGSPIQVVVTSSVANAMIVTAAILRI